MLNTDYWDISPSDAIKLQNQLRDSVVLEDDFDEIRTVAGVDLSIGRGWAEGKCGVVVLSFPELEVIETRTHTAPVKFPYVPGLLAFREIPIFLETYELLDTEPDLIVFDAQGYAHPRRFGLACHAGVLLNKPSIGCAKSKLTGYFVDPADEPGSVSPLIGDNGERIGDVLRTKSGVKPVFISPGHRITFDTATRFAIQCTRGHRIPEPTRLAHNLVSVTPIR
ncbi:MAG: deoxyribonuclease V [Armatimonadota bacterium]|nr:deoxyribonuclease V [bacterium]